MRCRPSKVEDLSSGSGLPGCGPGGPSVGSLEALQEVEFLSILQGDPIVNPGGVCVPLGGGTISSGWGSSFAGCTEKA
jgi:hypothetical protein